MQQRMSGELTAFGLYLRTGRRIAPADVEVKYNPRHDAENGRFTFAGQGRYFGGGRQPDQARMARPPRLPDQPGRIDESGVPDRSRNRADHPANYALHTVQRGDSLSRIAARRKGLTARDLAWLNGQAVDQPLKIGILTAAPTAPLKMVGQGIYVQERRWLWTLSRFMKEPRDALIASPSGGMSTETQIFNTSPTKRKAKPMPENKLDLLGPLMNEVGHELARIVGGDPDGVFLYVEIGEGWVRPSIFKNEGDAVRWYDPKDTDLFDLLFEAWHLEPDEPNMRWSVLEYAIGGGKFHVSMKYPEEVNVEEVDFERRQAALRTRFGDKPVVYPPMPRTAFELKP